MNASQTFEISDISTGQNAHALGALSHAVMHGTFPKRPSSTCHMRFKTAHAWLEGALFEQLACHAAQVPQHHHQGSPVLAS